MYLALSSRLSATESTLLSLSSQVSVLQQTVNRHLPSSSTSSSVNALPAAATSTGEKGESIAALTQQISALSSSVAQLQRLQSHSQTNFSRQHSGSERDGSGPGPARGNATSPTPTPSLGLGNLSIASTQNVFNTGPLTAPHPHSGPSPFGLGPGPGQGPKHAGLALPREFQSRPPVSRSASSNMIPPAPGKEGEKTWGPPTRSGPGGLGSLNPLSPGGGGWPTSMNVNSNANGPTTPGGAARNDGGGMMTPSVFAPGAGSQAGVNGSGNGPSAPGAGIVVTKWDHLNLKPELVRSVQKYGLVHHPHSDQTVFT
jgi:hypothetical protein